MKNAFVFLCSLALGVSLSAQEPPPDWIDGWLTNSEGLLYRPASKYKGGEFVVGCSGYVPESWCERHILAIYDALNNYTKDNEDPVVFRQTQLYDGSWEEVRTDTSRVDYALIDNYIDESGKEYVWLEVRPGKQLFYAHSREVSDGNCRLYYDCWMTYSSLSLPVHIGETVKKLGWDNYLHKIKLDIWGNSTEQSYYDVLIPL